MADDTIDIRVKLAGAREAARDAKGVSSEVRGMGKAGDKAATGFRRSSREASKHGKVIGGLRSKVGALTASYRNAAKGIVAAGLAFGTFEGIKSSVDVTTELARATISLSKNLGLGTEKASEWAAVARSRNIDTKALNMSFGTLAKNIVGAHDPTSTQADLFKQLGVSQKVLASGDFNKILGATADSLGKMGPGAERTAISMKLFGRGWQTIVPVLRDGSKGMKEQLALARKYGVTFKGKTIKSMEDFIAAQREGKFATMGLQLAIGTKLAPVLTKGITKLAEMVRQARSGHGTLGKLATTAGEVAHDVRDAARAVARFGAQHPKLAKLAAEAGIAYLAFRKLGGAKAVGGLVKLIGWIRRLKRAGRTVQIAEGIAMNVGDMWAGGPGMKGGGVKGKLGKFRSSLRGHMRITGKLAGKALGAGILAGLVLAGPDIAKWIKENVSDKLPGGGGDTFGSTPSPFDDDPNLSPFQGGNGAPYGSPGSRHSSPPGAASPPGTPSGGRHKVAGLPGGGTPVIHNHFYVDGKEVTTSVATRVQSDANRR